MKWKRITVLGAAIPLAMFLSTAATTAPAATTKSAPVVATLAATAVTSTTATLSGTVNPEGLATTSWFQWLPPDGDTSTIKSDGSGTGSVAISANITGLKPSTAYTYAAYASNSKGQKNGVTVSFTTPATTTPTPTSGPAQIPVLCFHDIGTPSSDAGSTDYYNVTLADFTAEMAWLSSNGYQTITPAQYTAWLAGTAGTLPAKPVLITFDDAFTNDFTEATPVLEKYGFHATAFIVTGYANGDYLSIDNGTNTPTVGPNEYALWSTIDSYATDGTWTIQFHAGECGHAYLPYAPASCLTGLDQADMTSTAFQYYIWNYGQTDAHYQARVTAETTAGLAEIQSEVGGTVSGPSAVFAAPFGAWGNGDDPWLISYWDSQFGVIFTQHIASSDEATAKADHVRYRLELGYNAQSASYLAANISNSAFTLAGSGSTVGANTDMAAGVSMGRTG